MRSPAEAAALAALVAALPVFSAVSYHVPGDNPGPWPGILGSVGFRSDAGGQADILVIRSAGGGASGTWLRRLEEGAFVILEGESAAASALGFRPTSEHIRVSGIEDLRRPDLSVVWEHPLDLPVFELPPDARVFTRDRWTQAPLVAGVRRGSGAVLWVAVTPGAEGYERFPYLVHALADLGLSAPFRSRRLWAFFDSSYRSRVDLDYFSERWRRAGIAALHVAAWHYWEPDPIRDDFLHKLIESCHRRGILVYAWLGLPHVSETFWDKHPEWREQTALLQDAHLDWRKLMNLVNRDCFRTVSEELRNLIDRFDWDGVNLAELYFESLQGYHKPSRFTPMNDDVRREFHQREGFDPLELFDPASPRRLTNSDDGLRRFLDFRIALARRIQEEWLAELHRVRRSKPDLDLVLTHVDDQFDSRVRDAIGADAAGLMPLLGRYDFTFLVEDPATIWNLGPGRYREIADRYRDLTPRTDRLAIDINIVERYQDVYPTKQQTGTELFQLVSTASRAFARVALYFENSILAPDVPWLSSAAAVVGRFSHDGSKLVVSSLRGVGISWSGPATVNGRLWPVQDDETLMLPAGEYTIEPAGSAPPVRLLDFTGELKSAAVVPLGIEFSYESSSRALAILDRRPLKVEIDGKPARPREVESGGRFLLYLPRGQHVVRASESPRVPD